MALNNVSMGALREYIEILFKAMPQVCRLLTQYFDVFQLKGTLREYIETLFNIDGRLM
jgi:hypothetical protein